MSFVQFFQLGALLMPLVVLHKLQSDLDAGMVDELTPVPEPAQSKYLPIYELSENPPSEQLSFYEDTQPKSEDAPPAKSKPDQEQVLLGTVKVNQVLGFRKHKPQDSDLVIFMNETSKVVMRKRECKIKLKNRELMQQVAAQKTQIEQLKRKEAELRKQLAELSE